MIYLLREKSLTYILMFIHKWSLSVDTVSLNIKQWGNSLGIRLPAAIAKAVGLKVDQCVEIAVKGQAVIITPCKEKPLTLEDRLARFDPHKHSTEEMVSDKPRGAEKW